MGGGGETGGSESQKMIESWIQEGEASDSASEWTQLRCITSSDRPREGKFKLKEARAKSTD